MSTIEETEATEEEAVEEVVVFDSLEERLVHEGWEVLIDQGEGTMSANSPDDTIQFQGDIDVLHRVFLTGAAQEMFSALMSGEVTVEGNDLRDITDTATRWKVTKELTFALTGVRQNPVVRNLTPSEVAAEGRKRDLSRGRPSKWAQALILHTEFDGNDVEAWTTENTPESRGTRNFKGFALAQGLGEEV